ncbi:phenylalanyl-tRNA synthetase, alpha subunit [Verrucomicrobium sp. GAS474]|uniref:phenylalanine--tRNA ligase subunit alpha n=1 Tax=Verrucomicrobium sp. GAS474 TaxID=1882831 RepID=UPI00087BF298|nr:phenylalanine--tRNA ligase subunit alpha [Verrucomicrobium sp. GAS474]SDU29996.1 phenylalanyl-tRNA synthetase, alpha subunit [Verrucomicrobium sp. GAS474]
MENEIRQQIDALRSDILSALAAAPDAAALEEVRLKYFSKNGLIAPVMEKVGSAPKELRPVLGRLVNEFKATVNPAFEERKNAFAAAAETAGIDATLPGRPVPVGSLHPIYAARDRAIGIFRRLGFALADGPDIETEHYNFDALNTPKDHPARNEGDTFYLADRALRHGLSKDDASAAKEGRLLLRTQTSPVQIRVLEQLAASGKQPPVRIVAPGRCYRRDEIDATHGIAFHQMEGLVVDEGVSLADLKGTLELFFRELLGEDLKFRFRPHFFPFTEPSFEVDASRPGNQVKGREWLEICGCGMVHPKVLANAGIDPERYTGFAFGFGIERIAMMVHQVNDLRLFGENDVRLLSQLSPKV